MAVHYDGLVFRSDDRDGPAKAWHAFASHSRPLFCSNRISSFPPGGHSLRRPSSLHHPR